jgi:uncharacterized protein (DUF58 family)
LKNLKEIYQSDRYKNIELIASGIVEGFMTGLHRSPYHGFSVEFAEHRAYNTGESTRFIDWKLYGRTEKLYVKRFEEETNLRCYIMIDTSSSMLFPVDSKINKLNFAVYSSAALINMLKRQRDAAGLVLFSNKQDFFSEAKLNANHLSLLYSKLDSLLNYNALNVRSDIVNALNELAEIIHKRSMLIIFSDMFARDKQKQLFEAIKRLRFKGVEIILFHLIDEKKEIDFEFKNRPYKFVDLETGESIKLTPSQMRSQIKNAFKEYTGNIKTESIMNNVSYVKAGINRDFNQILIPYLANRHKLL